MVALQNGDRSGIVVALREFKLQGGGLNYPAIFSVPSDQRITKMAERSFHDTLTVITAAVTLAMESLNLKQAMTSVQIVDLSEAIIDTASEDNLSIEDLMLFLQRLTNGVYNPLYESMDIAKFMEKFEVYRQERHEAILSYRENRHLELKALGDSNRSAGKNGTALDEHLSAYTTKLQAMKDELNEKKQENKRLRQQRDF